MPDKSWCVLQVNSNHEKKVAHHLVVRSVEHFLPLYTDRRRWTDRTVSVECPLFPGYVFVRFPTEKRITVISTPGVLRLLGEEERDVVSAEEIDRIRAGLTNGLRLRPHPRVALGTQVRVRSGIFAGVQGVVTDLRHQCRVVMSMAAVPQYFSLEVDIAELDVLDESVAKLSVKPASGPG